MPSSDSSADLDPYETAECWTATDIGTAPQNARIDLELPPVRAVRDGVLAPPDTARHVLWRLHCLRLWPLMAQAKLDEQHEVHVYDLARERLLVDELRNAQIPEPRTPWELYIGLPLGGIAVGLILGIALGG